MALICADSDEKVRKIRFIGFTVEISFGVKGPNCYCYLNSKVFNNKCSILRFVICKISVVSRTYMHLCYCY